MRVRMQWYFGYLAQFLHAELSSNCSACHLSTGPALEVPLHLDRLLNGIIMSFPMFLLVRFTLPACDGFFLGFYRKKVELLTDGQHNVLDAAGNTIAVVGTCFSIGSSRAFFLGAP